MNVSETTYVDKRGYERDSRTGRLVHRTVAYHQIYLLNKGDYPLRFRYYDVHHVDGDKLNNCSHNLKIISRGHHKIVHGEALDGILRVWHDWVIFNPFKAMGQAGFALVVVTLLSSVFLSLQPFVWILALYTFATCFLGVIGALCHGVLKIYTTLKSKRK